MASHRSGTTALDEPALDAPPVAPLPPPDTAGRGPRRIVGPGRLRADAALLAVVTTIAAPMVFVAAGDPFSLIVVATLGYLVGVALPCVAGWRLHRNDGGADTRGSEFSIVLGVATAAVWLVASVLAFQRFGRPVVIIGLVLAMSGLITYAWQTRDDPARPDVKVLHRTTYRALAAALGTVLAVVGVGYLVASSQGVPDDATLLAVLRDCFVVIGLLTIAVGLVLPGTFANVLLAGGQVGVRTDDEYEEMAAVLHRIQDEAARTSIALDEATGELQLHRDELARLVEERTVALIAAHEEIEQAHRRRQDMHERMRILSSRLGSADPEGADLPATIVEIASTVGQVLDVDVVAIYTADDRGRFVPVPTVWHPERFADVGNRSLMLTESSRQFFEGVAAREGTLALADVTSLPEPPEGTAEPAFVNTSGYAAWVLSPVHDASGSLLALLGLGMVHPVAEWNDDDIALIDSVGSDLGRAIVQASLHARQLELVRQLQDLDRAKSEFLSTFSHELRTPLTSIRAYTELLRDHESIDGEEDRMLEIIERNSMRLSVLIEDILTLSHLNSAVYDIRPEPVDIDPLISSVCESLLPTAAAKSLTLTAHPAAGCAEVLGDEHQLERLLLNLVSNAIKFTPDGGQIEVSTVASGSSVVLSVADTGIGIPVDEQQAVFGRFVRGAEATQEVIPGTGLGLAIVQAIVEHHGGRLTLDSTPGEGTTVSVELPSSAAPCPPCELEAQGAADRADTGGEDLAPVGVRTLEDDGRADRQLEAHSKEHQ